MSRLTCNFVINFAVLFLFVKSQQPVDYENAEIVLFEKPQNAESSELPELPSTIFPDTEIIPETEIFPETEFFEGEEEEYTTFSEVDSTIIFENSTFLQSTVTTTPPTTILLNLTTVSIQTTEFPENLLTNCSSTSNFPPEINYSSIGGYWDCNDDKGYSGKRKCKLKKLKDDYLCKGVAKCDNGFWNIKSTRSVWCKPQCNQNELPELPLKNERTNKPSKWRRKKQAVQARQAFSFRIKRKQPEILRCLVLAICEDLGDEAGGNKWTLRKKGESCNNWEPFTNYPDNKI